MAEVFSIPARERLSKKKEQLNSKIMGKYEKMAVPSMELNLGQAIGLIFEKDEALLKLLGSSKLAQGFEHNMLIMPQEEQKQEVKSVIEPEKEAAMKKRLLDQAKAVTQVVEQAEDEEELEDFLDDLI